MPSQNNIFVFVVVALLIVAGQASAQPLADRVPADALVYIGWAGSQNLGPAYDASHLKAVAASSEWSCWFAAMRCISPTSAPGHMTAAW